MAREKSATKDSIKTLEGIGLREVSRKTYIELNYLKLMASKDFSKLQRIKTLGFVKIIQREYNVDMSDWVAEFEAYLQDNEKPIVKETDEILQEHKKIDKRKKIYIAVAVAVLILLAIFIYAFVQGRASYIKDISASNDITYENVNEFLNPNIQINQTQASEQSIEKNSSNETVLSDLNATIESAQNISMTEQKQEPLPKQQLAKPRSFKASISPNTELWVGIVDLSTFRKSTYMQENAINLNIDKEQLIITGHGDFTLKVQNEDDRIFNPRERVYLYVKDGKIQEISVDEFTTLNRGKTW